MTDGTFVTLEGIDGAGKSTIADHIREEFPDAEFTSEPSPLPTGQLVRSLLSRDETHPVTDFMAFMADRSHHIQETIRPAVEDGRLVVSDRYADSTRAYQPIFLEDYVERPSRFIETVMEPFKYPPDCTIYFDIDPQVAIERLEGDKEKYEKLTTMRQVYNNYKTIGHTYSKRWNVVDAERDEQEIADEVIEIINGRL